MSTLKHTRHQARILALQAMYQLDLQRAPSLPRVDEILAPLAEEAQAPPEAVEYARKLTLRGWANHERYDKMIAEVSSHWDVSRMAVVDRNILRLALYEIVEQPDVPLRVIMDEAIELGREFGEAETPQFINGVLDAIWKNNPVCRVARPESDR